jgi:hypothetical protein
MWPIKWPDKLLWFKFGAYINTASTTSEIQELLATNEYDFQYSYGTKKDN